MLTYNDYMALQPSEKSKITKSAKKEILQKLEAFDSITSESLHRYVMKKFKTDKLLAGILISKATHKICNIEWLSPMKDGYDGRDMAISLKKKRANDG